MTTLFFNRANVDFDDLFERDPAGVAIPGFNDEFNNPLLFASIELGTKIADVEHYHPTPPHLDVTNYWAGKGTVIRVSTTALPSSISAVSDGSPPSVTATVAFTFNRNGVLSLSPGGSANWVSPQTPTVGDLFDIRFTVISGNSIGTLSGTFDEWVQINVARGVSLSVTVNQAVARTAERYVRVEIRRRSNLVVVYTGFIDMSAEAGIT